MSIVLEQLSKRYEGYPVVNDVSLEIADGEFFVLLGPSGSGKSTVLRIIAGLTAADGGRVQLHGRDVTGLAPQDRGVGFVFQHYALFRHMSVAENVEFGLRVRKMPSAERRRRRDELLELVGLAGLGRRMPRQLSGGQQQRVALARALAYQPAVLLLDEPFGALDAKIRVELRRTLRRIQREVGTTTIFVTHDQEEAFELADRLGVMNAGRLLEVGPPDELYQRPQTEFVATFLGTANLLVGRCDEGGVQIGALCFPLNTAARPGSDNRRVQVLFRPEDLTLAPRESELAGPPLGAAEVEQVTFAGSFERLRLRLPPIAGVRPIAPPVPYGSDFVLVEATRSPDEAQRFPLASGDRAWVGVRRIHALAHPGLSFLLLVDGSPAARAALDLGGQIARLAHARTTVLVHGAGAGTLAAGDANSPLLQDARERLGSGLPALEARADPGSPGDAAAREAERHPYDLVVLAAPPGQRVDLAEQVLRSGEHHVLLVAGQHATPARALICASPGEPGKEDVLFAGRLLRHLGTEATLLSVLREGASEAAREQVGRFLAGGLRTLSSLGVPGAALTRAGSVRDEILAEIASGAYDLVVLGAPLGDHEGRGMLAGVVGQVINAVADRPVLIVRSPYAAQTYRPVITAPRLISVERT